MNKNQDTKEKTCVFFASDYHFEMISLPYINKSIENNVDVIILTENDLEKTVKVLLSKIILKDEIKNKLLEIDWKNNNDFNKLKIIKTNIEEEKETVIFVKGKENYLKNINKNLEKWINKNNKIKVIDCYDIEEIQDRTIDIMNNYNIILNTVGKKEIFKF